MAAKRHKGAKKLSVETHRAHAAEDVLKKALEELKWTNVTAATSAGKGSCDIYWRGPDYDDPEIPKHSYIARIPGMSVVSHKAELAKHLNRMQQFFPDDYTFYPRTWILPDQQEEFESYVQLQREKRRKPPTYIVKPDGGAQGEGIFLVQSPRDLPSVTLRLPAVVQEYVSDPLLLSGLKFDLRLYVLVSGLDPLEVSLSRTGMARFCTMPYQPPSVKNLHHTFMHLTNYSLNKRSKDFVLSEEGKEGEASKRTLSSVLAEMEGEGMDTTQLWDKLEEMVGKTMVAVLPQLEVERSAFLTQFPRGYAPPSGFQVLGFDVLLDSQLQPHLLEVNAHPSLRVDQEKTLRPGVVEYIDSPVDVDIKLPVVRDTLRVIGSKIKRKGVWPDDCCLKEVLPVHLDALAHLRLFEQCAQLYVQSLGVRGGVKMGPTAFRAFTRQYNLCNADFTSADVDILYINMLRRYSSTMDRNDMSFSTFCYALMHISSKLYLGSDTLHQLLAHCAPV